MLNVYQIKLVYLSFDIADLTALHHTICDGYSPSAGLMTRHLQNFTLLMDSILPDTFRNIIA
jgi:hypothetical protein